MPDAKTIKSAALARVNIVMNSRSFLRAYLHTARQTAITLFLAALLVSCGGDDYQRDMDRNYVLSGRGLDGPMTNANVAVYALLDVGGANVVYSTTTPGSALVTGVTDNNAKFAGLEFKNASNPPYIVEFTATASTVDLTTGVAPVLPTVRTLVTEDMLKSGAAIYGTPLTTLAIEIALSSAGGASRASFDSALAAATSQVKSTLGMGMASTVDLFTTPPIVDTDVDATDSATLQAIAQYRSAIESVRVMVQQIAELVSASGTNVLKALGGDLADGVIDGNVNGSRSSLYADDSQKTSALAVVTQTPATLCIAKNSEDQCTKTVADINSLLASERTALGITDGKSVEVPAVTTSTVSLTADRDGDGHNNDQDAFPDNANEWADTDADSIGDNHDNCPTVSNPDQLNTDGDGFGDACDSNNVVDTDGDGVADGSDNCPTTANANQLDSDSDGTGDVCDSSPFPVSDTDGDGVADTSDNCPSIANSNQLDTDSDGKGDVCDSTPFPDTDHDGVADTSDNCPSVSNANQLNTDGDSQGNACDLDDDNDTYPDTQDAFPLDAQEHVDTDDDGVGDVGDNCPLTSNHDQLDTDSDHVGNACDTDDDNDGVLDDSDNCPLVSNLDQVDSDGDDQGDACDTDDDNDGLSDVLEAQLGSDPLNADSDSDGVQDGNDNCPIDPTPDYTDTDDDGRGDICDTDDDNDTVLDAAPDNCPLIANLDQLDTDLDGTGNACDDDDDGDGVADVDDAFPLNGAEWADADHDGVGDNSDNCPSLANTNQLDSDLDGAGNVCDDDDDNDTLSDDYEISIGSNPLKDDTDSDGNPDYNDNCILVANPTQVDSDGDGYGDACSAPSG